jgi:hypothetical protein
MDVTTLFFLPLAGSSAVHAWISRPFCGKDRLLDNSRFACDDGGGYQFGPPFFWGVVVFSFSLVAAILATLFMGVPWFASLLVSCAWSVFGGIVTLAT